MRDPDDNEDHERILPPADVELFKRVHEICGTGVPDGWEWREAAREYHKHRPPMRTDAPKSLSDEAAWAAFDRRERERPSLTEHQQFLRRLLEPNVSIDSAYAQLNDCRRYPTPKSVVEAILYCVRVRGVAALKEPANIERLARCDQAARAEIDRRIAKIKDCKLQTSQAPSCARPFA